MVKVMKVIKIMKIALMIVLFLVVECKADLTPTQHSGRVIIVRVLNQEEEQQRHHHQLNRLIQQEQTLNSWSWGAVLFLLQLFLS
jgi:cell division protein FtsL